MDYVVINFLQKHLNWDIKFLSKITPLGGLSNKTYKIFYYDVPYFVRLCNSSVFNVNRTSELKIINIASDLNLCSSPLYFNTTSGNMVCYWLEGTMPTESEFNTKNFLDNLCFNIKKLHNSKFDNNFNPFNEIRNKINICNSLNIKLPYFINSLTYNLLSLEEDLSKSEIIGLCHNDLNVSNIIKNNDVVNIIDYEFSGNCDIFYDLATIAWMQDYNGRVNLLTAYFGHFNNTDYDKLIKYLYVVKFHNALWSIIKSTTSNSDYNYYEGANIIFNELYESL